jgi:membrane protease YdiL (CAAX protease family)
MSVGILFLGWLPLVWIAGLWAVAVQAAAGEVRQQVPVEWMEKAIGAREWADALVLAGGAVIVAPLWEELFFRGYLQRWLAHRSGSVRGARAIAALVFALIHGPSVGLPIFVVGWILGWIYDRTGNLLDAVLFHALFNFAQLALLALSTLRGGP